MNIFICSMNTYEWDIEFVTVSEEEAIKYAKKERTLITVFKNSTEYPLVELNLSATHYSREHQIDMCRELGLTLMVDELEKLHSEYVAANKTKEERNREKELKLLAQLKAKYEQ